MRRAFLCGEDPVTERSYDHRKQWIVDRIASLSAIFAIDVCAYAVMSNHCHVVLRVKPDTAGNWTAEEVVTRWKALFRGVPLVDSYLAGKSTSDADKAQAETWIETVRHFRGKFHHYVGPVEALQRHGEAMGCRRVRGIGACRRLWGSGASSGMAAAA